MVESHIDPKATLWSKFEHLSLREKTMLAIYRKFKNIMDRKVKDDAKAVIKRSQTQV